MLSLTGTETVFEVGVCPAVIMRICCLPESQGNEPDLSNEKCVGQEYQQYRLVWDPLYISSVNLSRISKKLAIVV